MEKHLTLVLVVVCLYYKSPIFAQSCANPILNYPVSLACSDTTTIQPDTVFPPLPQGKFIEPYGLAIDTATGQIFPSVSIPGFYQIQYLALDSCNDTATYYLQIAQRASATFLFSPASICTDGANSIPVITGDSGGVFSWSGSGLLDLDSLSGAILPATSDTGTYTVTYSVAGDCPASVNVLITVDARPVPEFRYTDSVFCGNSTIISPVLLGNNGGRFSAFPIGLALDSLTGKINPGASVAGLYSVVHSFSGNCPAADTVSVRILPVPDPAFTFPVSNCLSGPNPVPGSVVTSGGAWSIYPSGATINATNGVIDLQTSNPGFYLVRHTLSGTCPDSVFQVVQLVSPNPAGFSYPASQVCNSGSLAPVLSGLGGGVFSSSPAGLSLNAASGLINLNASQPGNYQIRYIAPGTCADTALFALTVNPRTDASFRYLPAEFCAGGSDPFPAILGDSGGVFRVIYGPCVVDSVSGKIFLNQSQPSDSIIIRYVVGSNGTAGCADSLDFRIRILQADTNVSLAYDNAAYCRNYTNPAPQLTGAPGGIFEATPTGLRFTSNFTGQVDLPNSQPGTYLIRYYPPGACTDTSNGFYLTVLPDDRLGFSFPNQACSSENEAQPIGLIDTLGIFLEPSGGLIFLDMYRGIIDLSNSQPGIYAIQYASGGDCKRDTNLTFALYPSPEAELFSNATDNLFCEGDSTHFLAFGGDRYEFRVNSTITQALQPQSTFTPAFPLQDGDWVSVRVAMVQGGCEDRDTLSVRLVGTPRLSLLDYPQTVAGAEAVEIFCTGEADSMRIWWQISRPAYPSLSRVGSSKQLQQSELFTLTDTTQNPDSLAPDKIQFAIVPQLGSCAGDTTILEVLRLPEDAPFLIPGLITPNGDGANDTWRFAVRDGVNPDEYRITLLNRSGGTVWQQDNLRGEWNPQSAPEGVYWWVVRKKGKENEVMKGGLTIRSN